VIVSPSAYEADLQAAVAEYFDNPLEFVIAMYPWGEPGFLKNHDGPDEWQERFLGELGDQIQSRGFNGVSTVMPVRMVRSSGHGVGKTVMAAMVVDFIMSTRPHAQGVVTANTSTQLETKTWAAIRRWTRICKTGHWFEINTQRMYHRNFPESWFCTAQTCREENSEAFAGQHAADSSSFYVNDEDSAVPDAIHDVQEGGLTDGEAFQFLFGNATRSTGKFYRACFGSDRHRYNHGTVDARESRFTNKALIAEWAQDHGEDSDFFRVRVKGLPPKGSDLQFIDSQRVADAQRREPYPLPDDPLIVGLDIARGGNDDCVFMFRRGVDARSLAPIVIPGEQARDSMRLITKAAQVLSEHHGGRRIAAMFIDGTGIGGPICDRLRQMGHRNIFEVQFGAESPDPKCANMRAYMWREMREWLTRGAIDPKRARLESDLSCPGFFHDKQDRLVLESKEQIKKRGEASPDEADALALTFAGRILPPKPRAQGRGRAVSGGPADWLAT
jgi:hypothetical protein